MPCRDGSAVPSNQRIAGSNLALVGLPSTTVIAWLPGAAGDELSSEFLVQSEEVAADGVGYRVPRAQYLLSQGQQGGKLLTGPGLVSRLVGHSGEAGLRREGVRVLGTQHSLGLGN